MRLDPKLVHPSIFKATDGVMWSGKGYSMEGANAKAVAEHQRIWFQQYGKGCLAYAVLSVVAFIGSVSVANSFTKPWKGLFVIGVMLAVAAAGMYAYYRNSRQITLPELGALLPMLELSEVQQAYSETMIGLEKSGRDRTEIEDTMRALNSLLDEDEKLAATRETLSGSGTVDSRERLAAEREKLVGRIASARDPEAKTALENSLTLLDERISAFDALGSQYERIEAQQELLRQAVLATRDAALHRGAAPALPNLGTDALRAAVARAREQAQETERALAELRAG